jgi:predicted PurR-regulated permease PerM
MKQQNSIIKYGVAAFLVLAAAITFAVAVINLPLLLYILHTLLEVMSPVFIGFVLAYLMYPICKFFERFLLRPLSKRMKMKNPDPFCKNTGIVLGAVTFALFLAAILTAVIPQIILSVQNLIQNINVYAHDITVWIEHTFDSYPDLRVQAVDITNNAVESLREWLQTDLIGKAGNLASVATGSFFHLLLGMVNIIMGVFISIYFLHGRLRFKAQGKKLLYGVFSQSKADAVIDGFKLAHKYFNAFIVGKLLESVVIGFLFFVTFHIFGFSYAILFAVILGITNIVPHFGHFIGAIPCLCLILLVQPEKTLLLLIIIIIFQQIDSNFLTPVILGEVTGLNSFWVIFALLLGGWIFGVAGLVIGIPLFATAYTIIGNMIKARLKKKNLPAETDEYMDKA